MASDGNVITQSSKTIPGDEAEAAYSAGYYTPQHYNPITKALANVTCKAIENNSASNLTVVIHRINDRDSAGAARYSKLVVPSYDSRGVLFDSVKEDGSDTLTADLNLIPE